MSSLSSSGGSLEKREKSGGKSALSLPQMSAVLHPSAYSSATRSGAKSGGIGTCGAGHELPSDRPPPRSASPNSECVDQHAG